MLSGAFRMRYGEKSAVELNERLFHISLFIRLCRHKGILQRLVLLVMMLKELYEVQHIGSVKGAVRKTKEAFQICLLMTNNKVVRGMVHPAHQPVAIIYDGGPVAPCQYCCEQPGYFLVLRLAEGMRDADGVVFNE